MKQITVIITTIIVFFSACNNGGKEKEETTTKDTTATTAVTPPAETPPPPAFTPFKIFMVQHTVKDYNKWKDAYMSHDSMRQAYGISNFVIGRGLTDSNTVIVFDKMNDVQKAKEFSALPNLKEAMKKGGVTGAPSFSYWDVVRNDDTKIDQKERVMVAHKVKNYDKWLKVYDEEGTTTRAANGLIDRALARGVEDSNMVFLVFAITDMAKAKARFNSPELKKIMTDAGVEGAPKSFFYKIVEKF